MRQLHHPLFSLLLGLSVVAWVGCNNTNDTGSTITADSHNHDGEHDHDGDHGDDHGHDDDHDHDGDGKPDHVAHDHDGDGKPEHEAHDHVGDHGEAGHDHGEAEHKHESLPEALAELKSLRDEIAKGVADGKLASVDSQVHHVGDLLEDISGLFFKSDLSKEQKEKNVASIDVLFEAFGAVDKKIHGNEGKDFDDVKNEVDEAIKALQESIQGHDHSGE